MLDLISGLERAIRDVRGDHPLRRVAVVVPIHLLGVSLSRSIFALTGHMAIDFVLLHELAWTLACGTLLAEGRARVPENVDLALLLAAIPKAVEDAATPTYLRDAAGMAGFAPAALRTLQDLAGAQLTPDALESGAAKAADPERLRLMARLWRGQTEALDAAHLVDRARLYQAAAATLPAPDLGVVVCPLDDPTPSEAAFLEALKKHQPFAVILEGGAAAAAPRYAARETATTKQLGAKTQRKKPAGLDTALARAQHGLFAPIAADTEQALDSTLTVLSAPGEALEAVEIARLIQQAADDGVRFEEIAVLLRSRDRYAAALASAFDRAGIEAFFVEGVPRVDPAARGLSLLLDLVGSDLDRARVMELLTTARIPWDSILGPDADVSPARWDRLSAMAGIVSGLDAWRARLTKAKQDREAREYQDDRDLRLYDGLLRVVERLAAGLATLPAEGAWSQFLDATLGLLETWIVRPELTRERLERVLGPLARYAPPPTRDQFLARVRELLATQVYREGAFGEGRVFVGSIAAARGLRFRLVFVPGLVERAFPGVVRPDPLLLDEEREALSPHLRTTIDAQESERLLFLDAIGAAEERLVRSYPRFDTSSGRERVPSSFLLYALEAAMGRRVGAADLPGLATASQSALGRPHPTDPARAIDRIERDLALVASGVPGVARHLAHPESFLVRSLAQEQASWEPRLTAWDGIVEGAGDALRLSGQVSSASAAERFAECPYRHLLDRGARLRKWEEPERAYQIEGKDFGKLYHAAAHLLFAELADQGRLPLTAATVAGLSARVIAIVEAEVAAFAREGGIVNAALLDPVRVRLKSDLEEMLRDELESAGEGFVPTAFEHEFADVPVTLADGTAVRFRGKIDRIDIASDGRVRVVDYKTGKYWWGRDAQFKGGTALQLAIYNQAARAAYPESEVTEAVYYYATGAGEYKRKGCPCTPKVDATLRSVLSGLDQLAAAGVFPPVADNCTFCDYQTICGPFRVERAARKAADPRLASFRALREIL